MPLIFLIVTACKRHLSIGTRSGFAIGRLRIRLTKRWWVVIIRNMSNYRTKDTERFAEMFKALSNPNRLTIFLRLASCCALGDSCSTDTEPCECVGELGRDLGIAPSTVSHHIKELHRAGLIRIERRGQNVECSAEPESLHALATFLGQPEVIRSPSQS